MDLCLKSYGPTEVVLQVRWVKSKWRFPSAEPRICLVSQLEHGEYTEEMAAHTCKWETGHNPQVYEINRDSHRQHLNLFLEYLSSVGNAQYEYYEQEDSYRVQNVSLEQEIFLIKWWQMDANNVLEIKDIQRFYRIL